MPTPWEVGRVITALSPVRQNSGMPDLPLQPVDNPTGADEAPSKGSTAPGGSGGGIHYECPRCGAEIASEFYGPCESCRDALRATITAVAVDVAADDYEPKMNVTPNAVATKD